MTSKSIEPFPVNLMQPLSARPNPLLRYYKTISPPKPDHAKTKQHEFIIESHENQVTRKYYFTSSSLHSSLLVLRNLQTGQTERSQTLLIISTSGQRSSRNIAREDLVLRRAAAWDSLERVRWISMSPFECLFQDRVSWMTSWVHFI